MLRKGNAYVILLFLLVPCLLPYVTYINDIFLSHIVFFFLFETLGPIKTGSKLYKRIIHYLEYVSNMYAYTFGFDYKSRNEFRNAFERLGFEQPIKYNFLKYRKTKKVTKLIYFVAQIVYQSFHDMSVPKYQF